MSFQQCELPLLLATKNHALDSQTKSVSKRSRGKLPRFKTTKEAVQALNLESDYMLRKARSHGSAYRSDRYIAVPAGRNKWEIFHQRKA
jgi:hypothetical protein